MDPDTVAQIETALQDASRVDERRIQVEARNDAVVLRGAVSSPEEASAATLIAESYADSVVPELQVDPNLREGVTQPRDSEEAVPAENEILIGDADMLSGPESTVEPDLNKAMEENVPWDPPTEPHLSPAGAEYGGATSEGGPAPIDTSDPDPDRVDRSDYAAADLSREELDLPAERVPSLDPEGVQASEQAEPDPVGIDSLGASPPDEPEPFPSQVPGTGQGVGGVGEGTAGGGGLAGEPATESGAKGADTSAADPARSTGGSLTDAGTSRGPQARPDEPLREDFPDSDPEDS